MRRVLAKTIVSYSRLSLNFAVVMRKAQARPVAVLKNNKIQAYLISADFYESMLSRLDDVDLMEGMHARKNEIPEPFKLDEL